jgi:hypothetical protein
MHPKEARMFMPLRRIGVHLAIIKFCEALE